MKQADVIVAEVYITKISGGLGKVRVLERTTNYEGRTVFKVARLETPGRVMERTAAALRPLPTIRLKARLTDAQLQALTEQPDMQVRELARLEIARRAATACAGVGCACGRDHGDAGDREVPHLAQG